MNSNNSRTTPCSEMGQHSGESGGEAPLFVDLDGTLVKSDLLIESILALVKSEPAACLSVIAWLRRGKAYLKSKIAEKVDINAQTLPYHRKFLEFLRAEAARGRSLYLTTAANQKFAAEVASHLGIFHSVLASSDTVNLKGRTKLVEIQKVCGRGQFDYAGNACADIDIWRHARRALLVNPQPRVESAARKIGNMSAVFDDRQKRFFVYVEAMRLHQWLKNLLLFVPMLTAHAWRLEVLGQACVAAVAFGLAASSVYLLKDMLDLEFDRSHPRKCTKPFATGAVPLPQGFALMAVLGLMSLALGAVLSSRFLAVVGVYLALSTAYSVYLKQYVLIDVIVLALLYMLRVIAGAVAIAVVMSFWLLAFAMFLFMSLALVKRCAELASLTQIGTLRAGAQNYVASDFTYLSIMGTANGYLSVLVLALFINSPDVVIRYSNPQVLWLLCPLMLYWISRLWLKTGRGEIHDDPVVFALVDRGSRYVIAGMIAVVLLSL